MPDPEAAARAHAPEEYLEVDSLVPRALAMAATIAVIART